MQNPNSKLLEDAIATVRAAGNPFVGSPNTLQVRQQLLEAVHGASKIVAEILRDYHFEEDAFIVKCVRGDTNTLTLNISLTPDAALTLANAGVMCAHCGGLHMKDVAEDNVAVMNAGYWPQNTRQCADCGELWEVRK